MRVVMGVLMLVRMSAQVRMVMFMRSIDRVDMIVAMLDIVHNPFFERGVRPTAAAIGCHGQQSDEQSCMLIAEHDSDGITQL